MITYYGFRTPGGALVFRQEDDGDLQPLDHRFDLRNHSPNGFEWGYGGSGPAQLALALLADHAGPEVAQRWYQKFKWAYVAKIKRNVWRMTDLEILAALHDLVSKYTKKGGDATEPPLN